MSIATYPIIILPWAFSDALNAELPPPQAPEPIILPAAPGPLPLVTVASIAAAALLALLLLAPELLPLVLLLLVPTYYVLRRAYHGARRRQLRRRQHYAEAVELLRTYPARQAAYQQALREYGTPKGTAAYRVRLLAQVLAEGSLSFLHQPTIYQPTQGVSEPDFADQLRRYFGAEHIHTGCGLPVHDPKLGASWFYPDFIYYDATGLRINIELDEPYTLRERTPIHCYGQDRARDAYFVRQRWAVLRFTEQQVVEQPALCCKELAQLIFTLNRRHYGVRFLADSLRPQPTWSWEQARQMAQQQVREQYLRLGKQQTPLCRS